MNPDGADCTCMALVLEIKLHIQMHNLSLCLYFFILCFFVRRRVSQRGEHRPQLCLPLSKSTLIMQASSSPSITHEHTQNPIIYGGHCNLFRLHTSETQVLLCRNHIKLLKLLSTWLGCMVNIYYVPMCITQEDRGIVDRVSAKTSQLREGL